MANKIWAISDNRVGHLAQIKSVLSLLPFSNKLFILNNSVLGKINCSFFPLGIKKCEKKLFNNELKKCGYPNIILAIGRRNLSVTLYLKRIIKKHNKEVKLIFLMPPGSYNKNIDYMFMHKYKSKPNYIYPSNVISINFPPAKINNEFLSTTNSQDLSNIINKNLKENVEYQKPYIGVVIGGKAKGVSWNTKVADKLCLSLIELLKYNKGTLFVTTSRRTGQQMAQYIKNKLPPNVFFWEYTDTNSYNPYLDILMFSDVIIVTGESTSMLTDSISLNSSAKVLVFDNKIFKGKRFKSFHNYLYKNNYALPLKEGKITFNNLPVFNKAENSGKFISGFITNLIANNTK